MAILPLAHAHGGKEFRLERVAGRESAESLLDMRQRNGLRLESIARHEAARLAVQLVVAERTRAMRAVIGPKGLGRLIAAGPMKSLGVLEQMPAYRIWQPIDVENEGIRFDLLPLAVVQRFMIWRQSQAKNAAVLATLRASLPG